MKMSDITVENLNHSNVIEWVRFLDYRQKVELAVYCSKMSIFYCTANSEDPKKALKAAKEWLSNPSSENREKCKVAANAAANASQAAFYAGDKKVAASAFCATNAAFAATDADLEAEPNNSRLYSYIADTVDNAIDAFPDNHKYVVKVKIVDYIKSKLQKPTSVVTLEEEEVVEALEKAMEELNTTYRYEKVDCKSIDFWECAKEYQSKLGVYWKDDEGACIVQDLEQLVSQYRKDEIYRRIEVTERELEIEAMTAKLWGVEISSDVIKLANKLHDLGFRFMNGKG